jgi:hypothetical protein
MATPVAPVVSQFSALLAPEFMPVGLAMNEVITGLEAFPVDELDEPHAAIPTQASRRSPRVQEPALERWFRLVPSF